MAHLSGFHCILDLVIVPVEQCTFLMEHNWSDIYTGVDQWFDQPQLLVGYSIWDDSRWLMAEAVELAGPDALCTENLKD